MSLLHSERRICASMIRERSPKGQQDEISIVLKTHEYALNYYFRELTVRCLTSWSCDHVGVSRYYITLRPPVVVDFEPTPPEKFYCEEKRKFFMEKGIVYVPIFLNQFMGMEAFAELVKREHEILARGHRELLEDQALLKPSDSDKVFNDPEILLYIDQEALRRVKVKKLKGVAAKKHLPHLKAEVIAELRMLAKEDGNLGRFRRNQQSPVVTR